MYSRRDFLKGLGAVVAAYALPAFAEEPKPDVQAKPAQMSLDELTEDYIKKTFGKYETAGDILKAEELFPTNIEYVIETEGGSDFKKRLENVTGGAALLLRCDRKGKDYNEKGAAFVAKYAAAQTSIPLIVYDDKLSTSDGDFVEICKNNGGTLGVPSIFLYANFDVVKGEKKDTGKGNVRIIDILRGGPADLNAIKPWTTDVCKYWLPTNISAPNGEYAWRSQNRKTAKGEDRWIKITYAK
mgnify:CR=1 FL=1